MHKIGTRNGPMPATPSRPAVISENKKPAAIDDASTPSALEPLALRVSDFCSRMGVSPSTFWKFVQLGKIRVVRFGGRTLIPADEAARILREGIR